MKQIKRLSALLIATVFFTGCYAYHEREYYSDIDNFITEEAVVNNIIYKEKDNKLVLWLGSSELYTTKDFIIRGDNCSLVIENGFLDKVKIGDTVTFTSAPRIYGNGYFMPIVEMKHNGEVFLDFETGYNNLMSSY